MLISNIRDKIINRALTREEYNKNLPTWYLPEWWYYGDEDIQDQVEDNKTEEIQPQSPTISDLLSDEDEEDYEEWVEQGKLIANIKQYFDNSLIWPEAMSIFLEEDYHGKTQKEYIEILYNLPSEYVVSISKNIRNKLDRKYELYPIINEAIKLYDLYHTKITLFEIIKEYFPNYKSDNVIEDNHITTDILAVPLDEYHLMSKIERKYKEETPRGDFSGVIAKKPSLDYYDNKRDMHNDRGWRWDYYKILDKQD